MKIPFWAQEMKAELQAFKTVQQEMREEARKRDEEARRRDEEARQRDEEARQRDEEARQRDEETRREFRLEAEETRRHFEMLFENILHNMRAFGERSRPAESGELVTRVEQVEGALGVVNYSMRNIGNRVDALEEWKNSIP